MSLSQPYPDRGDSSGDTGDVSSEEPQDTQRRRERGENASAKTSSAASVAGAAATEGAESAKAGAAWTRDFSLRIKNDEVTKLSAMLAYYFLMSIVPLLIVLLSFIGIVIGSLSPQAQQNLVSNLAHSTPVSQSFIQAALAKLAKSSGILAVASIVISLYTGSKLFLNIDYCFTKVYKAPLRRPLRRWLIAFAMLAVLVVLVPVLLAVSSLPSVLASAGFTHLFGHSTLASILIVITSALFAVLVAVGLFLAMYVVIPNQRLRVGESWQGAIVAGILLAIYIAVFPFYASHYLGSGSLAASAGFALVALVLCYYFGFILLIGAELNAFLIDRRQGGTGVPPPSIEVEG